MGADDAPDSVDDSLAPRPRHSFIHPRFATGRVTLGAAAGTLATLLTPGTVPWHVRSMVGWDAGALLYATLAWLMILRATPTHTAQRAAQEDPGRRLVFFIAIGSSIYSLFAAVAVLKELKQLPSAQVPVWTGLALAAVALSWIVTHTSFTLRYAHMFYRKTGPSECLQFPGTKTPSDLDFAYFAFTIGMCFQVSDVVITSLRVRRAALMHALVSFGFNTTILALSLNLLTTLLN
ncbi:MAG: DUF1345 domain-containing protein [Labilithrix sp.]